MPSSEEIYQARNEVENWYRNHLQKQKPNWPKDAITEVLIRTSYQEMLDLFVKETKAYVGPYSPY